MVEDFSLPGRERALATAYFQANSKERMREFAFARWTLLGRIIRKFKAPRTYCHLDGFDLDQILAEEDGFIGIGRVWHLPEPGVPGDIATILAVKFDPTRQTIQEANIWVGPLVLKRGKAPGLPGLEFYDFFSPSPHIDPNWKLAFQRDESGWHIDPDFDLSVFLLPRRDDTPESCVP